ncbi:MAG: hydrogenase formation protein HypD [Synechococcus sp.]|nr:hydrogenase formation protein HypD [Synechococcus sp.]
MRAPQAQPSCDPDRLPAASAADAAAVARLVERLAAISRHPWTLMEVCGGQTHAIVRWGLDQLLPPGLQLIHGPGCPVCVTPAETLEQALALARRADVILCSYGDMLRVPGRGSDTLLTARAEGADVRLLTSPLQTLRIAREHPNRQVVFLAVGFETTAPATALLARQILERDLANLTLLNAHVRVAPAMEAIVAEPGNRVQGFLAAGHVCAVLGTAELEALVARRRLPVVVSGFTARQLLAALVACVEQLEAGAAQLDNAYRQVVQAGGNRQAQQLLAEVFRPCDRRWRGLGVLAGGGLALRGAYARLDARLRFALPAELDPGDTHRQGDVAWPPAAHDRDNNAAPGSAGGSGQHREHGPVAPGDRDPVRHRCASGLCPAPPAGLAAAVAVGADRPGRPAEPPPAGSQPRAPAPAPGQICIAGAILRGRARPIDCPAFAGACSPEQPLGAPMVSSEGACAAYHQYRLGPDRRQPPLQP